MAAPAEREYRGSARIFGWYGVDEQDRFSCGCGWVGTFREMSNGWFEALIDGSCPSCDTMLVIRNLPTIPEIRDAAARGVPEAVEQLRTIQAASEEGSPSP